MKIDSIRDLLYIFRSLLYIFDFDQFRESHPLYSIQLVCFHRHDLGVKCYLLVIYLLSEIPYDFLYDFCFIRLYSSGWW